MSTPLAPTTEVGYGLASTGWLLNPDHESTPELQWPFSMKVYDDMRRQDAQVASVLRAVTLPVRRTQWRIDPSGSSPAVAAHVADDLGLDLVGSDPVKRPRTRDRFSWAEHLHMALLMTSFGHMFFEQVYRIDDAGLARLRKLAPRMPRSIAKVNVATDGGLESIEQYAPGGALVAMAAGTVTIPVSRLVAYVNDREGGNWLGTSLLRPAYKHWMIKDRLIRIQTATIDRNGMGIPRYTGADADDDLVAGEKLAKNWRSGEAAGAAIPAGSELDLVGVTGTLPDALPAIRYHDEQIGRSVLAHFLNLGTQTGSWALGTTFADFFVMSLQNLAQTVADTATQHVVEDIVDLNYGPDEPAPRVVFDDIGSKRDATADAIKMLIDAGAIFPDPELDAFVRNSYGLPPKAPFNAPATGQGAGQ